MHHDAVQKLWLILKSVTKSKQYQNFELDDVHGVNRCLKLLRAAFDLLQLRHLDFLLKSKTLM